MWFRGWTKNSTSRSLEFHQLSADHGRPGQRDTALDLPKHLDRVQTAVFVKSFTVVTKTHSVNFCLLTTRPVIMSALFGENYRCPACLVDLEGLHFLGSGTVQFPAEWLAAAYQRARYSMLFPRSIPWINTGSLESLVLTECCGVLFFFPRTKIFKTVWRYADVLEQHRGSSKISGRNFADELMISGV